MKKLTLAILAAVSTLMLAPTAYSKTSGIILMDRSGSMAQTRNDGESRCKYSKQVALAEINKFFSLGGDLVKVKGFDEPGSLRDFTNGFVTKSQAIAAVNALGDEDCPGISTALADAMCVSADELRNQAANGDLLRVVGMSDGDENSSPESNCGGADWQTKVTNKYMTSPIIAFDTVVFANGGNVSSYAAAPASIETAAPAPVTRTASLMPTFDYLVSLSEQTGGTATYHYDDTTVEIVSSPISIKSKKGSYTSNKIDVEMELWNNTPRYMSLKDMTVRYYFKTTTANPEYSGSVWYYDVTGNKPKIKCYKVYAEAGADNFCDIIFDKNAPSLAPNTALSLETVFYNSPSVSENMSDDYSNPSSSTSFTNNSKIVVYKDSKLVWGIEAKRNESPVSIESYDVRGSNTTIIEPVIFVQRAFNGTVSDQYPIDTKNLTVRYYIESLGAPASGYTAQIWYDNAPGGTPHVECQAMDAPVYYRPDNADMYCDVTFPNGGTVGQGNPEFQVDFAAWYGSWGGFHQFQSSDWSWNGTTRAKNERIAVFHQGALMWGEVPK